MALGLASLGRLESRVAQSLAATTASLARLQGARAQARHPSSSPFFAGERRLTAQARAMFGPIDRHAGAALLITCPADATDDPSFMLELARRRVEAVRINCAYDNPNTGHVWWDACAPQAPPPAIK
jgi:pyruvate kinase